jgi:hypothetical protein
LGYNEQTAKRLLLLHGSVNEVFIRAKNQEL